MDNTTASKHKKNGSDDHSIGLFIKGRSKGNQVISFHFISPRSRMNRNQYDSDITTWSPQGRLFQIEYAMNAVTQGSAAIGLKSKTHAVLASLKRSSSELASHQKKIFTIDSHMGIAIAGLAADARVISKYMRTECLNHKYVYDTPMQASRLINQVADSKPLDTPFPRLIDAGKQRLK